MKIGLAGPPGSGKSATANILTILYGYRQISFTNPLRAEVDNILSGRGRMPHAIKTEPRLEELRELLVKARGLSAWAMPTIPLMQSILQMYRTEFRLHDDPDYWVKRILPLEDHTAGMDFTYPNEKRPFDVVYYVYNPIAEAKAGQYRHASEGNILPQDCDAILDNSGTLDQLEQVIQSVLKT